MALAAVSNHSQSNVQPSVYFQALPPVEPPPSATYVSSLPNISANPLSSGQSASPASGTSASSASDSVVPPSVLNALLNYASPAEQAWSALTESLKSGDLSAARAALNSYTQGLSAPNSSSLLEITTPSEAFLEDVQSVGDAIASGSLVNARAALAAATLQRPETAPEAVSWAQGAASQDGWFALYTLEHPGSGSIDQAALASDIAAVDGALREEQVNFGDELVALGYSRADANKYAAALTGIGNSSTADNAQVDATRASQWIQGLIATAQNDIGEQGSAGQSSNLQSNTVSALLTGIEFANIDGWRQLESLMSASLQPVSASAGATSPGASVTSGA